MIEPINTIRQASETRHRLLGRCPLKTLFPPPTRVFFYEELLDVLLRFGLVTAELGLVDEQNDVCL